MRNNKRTIALQLCRKLHFPPRCHSNHFSMLRIANYKPAERYLSFSKITAVVFIISLMHAAGFSQIGAESPVSPNFIFETFALNRDIPTAAYPKYLSPIDMVPSPDKTKLYIAEQTAKSIAVFDIASGTLEKRIQLPNEVTGIAVSPDGSRIYATCSSDLWPDGTVCDVDVALGKVTNRIAVGHGARSPNITPDGKTLFVCNTFDNDISVVDLASAKETKRVKLIREPYASKLTPDGKTLVVANSLPGEKATDSMNISSKVQFVNTENLEVTAAIPLTLGSRSAYGVAISPDGKYAFVTHLIGMFTLIAKRLEIGGVHTNNMAFIDIEKKRMINDVPYDYATSGAANPWGITVSEDGKYAATVIAGSNELYVFDLPAFTEYVKSIDEPVSHNFRTFTVNVAHKRVKVKGKTPRTLAIIDDKIYTAGYFSDSLEIYRLNTGTSQEDMIPIAKFELGPSQNLTSHRMGEYRFNDATICLQNWQSCASCHPSARSGALNWILNTPQATQKNTKSMVYSWWTPPPGWAPKKKNAWESVRAGILSNLMSSPAEGIATPIDSFLVRLKPVPSPYLVKGRLSESAQRGKNIFNDKQKTSCAQCHSGLLFTDLKMNYSDIKDPFDPNKYWDTPSLVEAWRTAPYNHIGSYDKIEDMIRLESHSGTDFSNLTEGELKDLVEYVLSL